MKRKDPPSPDLGETRLCHCSTCVLAAKEDPDFDSVEEGGVWLPRHMFQRHKREEDSRNALRNSSIGIAGSPTSSSSHEPAQPSLLAENGRQPESLDRDRDERCSGPGDPLVNYHAEIKKAHDDLDYLQSAVLHRSFSFGVHTRLSFVNNPSAFGPYLRRPVEDLCNVNVGPFALDPKNAENESLLGFETDISTYLQMVESIPHRDDKALSEKKTSVAEQLYRELDRCDHLRESVWERQRYLASAQGNVVGTDDGARVFVDSEKYFSRPHHSWNPAILATYLVALLMHQVCGVSRRASALLLAGLRSIVRLTTAMAHREDQGAAETAGIPQQIPADIRTVVRRFDLEPRTKSYVCCPQCFSLYPKSPTKEPPDRCTYRPTVKSPACQAKLWMHRTIGNQRIRRPVRTYLHQEMTEWVARLFSRPGMESLLDAPLKRDHENLPKSKHDIWDAATFSTFLGSDGRPFLRSVGSQSRLVFCLAVDGFNPFQSKTAKQTASVTGIYMVCLNLPPHLRYLPENMYFVGVVPGPSKPSLDQINHALRPLVDDLSLFWKPGVFLSRTREHEQGRHVFAALIPLVCDLLGAKQVAGFSSHNSKYFCTYCLLPIEDIENFNKETWPPRDFEEHKARAKLWRDAETVEGRDKVFNQFGVRWSELFRLEYWNAILFIVVESMHLLYLGLLATHCREIWGMDVKMLDGDATFSPRTKSVAARPAPDVMLRASEVLVKGSQTDLQKLGQTVLWYLCLDRNINRGKSAKLLAKRLIKWRKKDEVTKYMNEIIREKAGDESTEPEQDIGTLPHVHSASDISQAIETLNKMSPISPSHLLAFNKTVLVNLCIQKSLSKQGNKAQLVDRLMKWRAEHAHLGDLSEEPPANLSKAARLEVAISNAEATFSAALAPSPLSLTAYTNDVLKALCKKRNLPLSGPKKVLVERLILWKTEGTAGVSAAEAAKNPGAKPALKTAVLGQTVLSEVHKDMTKTELPTWVSRAPGRFGTTEHGKLSADQWRTACTIHLPITLIRLWGNEDGRFKEMLENFIDLIVAVEIGSMLSVSPEHASLYDMLMKRYLDGVNALYKEANFVPNHHIALHLGDFMRSFGPVHAWRAFATERYNYLLQQVNTNQKFGDLELTFMKHACRTANLRPLMEEPQIRDSVFELVEAYEALKSEDRRGTRIKDTLAFAPVQHEARDPLKRPPTLDEASLQAISEALKTPDGFPTMAASKNEKSVLPDVTFYSRIFISGVTYRPSSHFPKDSNVIYRSGNGELAARIRHIFKSEDRGDQNYVIVQRVCELSDAHAAYDNYRKFSMGAGKLFYNRYEPTVEVVTADKIVCHFAKTTLHFPEAGGSCMHVLPLQRIMDAVSLPNLDDLAELHETPMDVD